MAELQFLDEVACPLPPGIQVSVYSVTTGGIQSTLIQTGFLTIGGNLQITWPTAQPPAYIAWFTGNEAPSQPQAFDNNGSALTYDSGYVYDSGQTYDNDTFPSNVAILNYRSPCKTFIEYANEGSILQPLNWYSNTAIAQGGVLHAVMRGLMAGQGAEDLLAQQVQEELRLQSCIGNEIDTWSLDMVGPMFQRFLGETDAAYVARLELMIGRPRCTINAIQAAVVAFYTSIQGEGPYPNANNLAFNVAGGFNASGGFNTVATGSAGPPNPNTVFVWDGMTQPGLAAYFGIVPTQFVIQIGSLAIGETQLLAFNLAGAFNSPDYGGGFNLIPTGDTVKYLPTPVAPDWRLGVIIAFIFKEAGTKPLYLVGQTTGSGQPVVPAV